MRVYILLCLAALVVLPLPAAADPGHSHKHLNGKPRFSAGEPGDPRQEARIIRVAMRETDDGKMIYEPNRIHVKRGESIRFLLENAGTIPHEFMLATPGENQKHGAEMQETPCQSAFKFDPASAPNFDPFERRVLAVARAPSELVGVAETGRARVIV